MIRSKQGNKIYIAAQIVTSSCIGMHHCIAGVGLSGTGVGLYRLSGLECNRGWLVPLERA
jgi:hypothetical protein